MLTSSTAFSGGSGASVSLLSSTPSLASSTWRGTRRTWPRSTTGSPERPPVALHSRAMAYAFVRPTRNRRPASSTVSRSGSPTAAALLGRRVDNRIADYRYPTKESTR